VEDVGRKFGNILTNARRKADRDAIFAAPRNREGRHADQVAGRLEIGVGNGRRVNAYRGTVREQIADKAVERLVRTIDGHIVIAAEQGDAQVGDVHRACANPLAAQTQRRRQAMML